MGITPEELERLNKGKWRKAYRAMQLIDGKLYPPMSAYVNGVLRDPIELGQIERAVENPDLADDKGYMVLDKGNKKKIKARYNPYFHSSPTMLNDQFAEAQDRPNLVTVEVEVPEDELDGTVDYKADKAKDSVGTKKWKAGIIQGQLSGRRDVNLSRYDKPLRIVPDEEVADSIISMFEGKDITMPSNVVPPNVRKELEKKGIKFVKTNNKGYLEEGDYKGDHYSWRYGDKAEKLYQKHLKDVEKKEKKENKKDMSDEEESFTKDLEDFLEKNPKGREDIPNAERRM